jgi:hypothetical protein
MLNPGQNVPSSITGTGTNKRDTGLLQNHIFQGGLSKPQILETLLIKFPQYYLLDVTEKLGLSKKISLYNGTYNWTKMGRTRKGSAVSSVTNNTTATATITTDIAYTSTDLAGYWIVNDTFYVVDSGVTGIVTAIGNSGGFQTIDVQRMDGANWAVATLAAAMKIGHTGSAYGEGSTGGNGFRVYLPDQDYNYSTTSRRSIKVSRNAMQDKTVLGDGSWFYNQEDFEQKEFMRDIEATMLVGTRYKSASVGGRSQSRGLLEYVAQEGQSVTYSGAVGAQEADLKLLITNLVEQNGSKEILLACGRDLYADLQSELGNNYRPLQTSLFQEKTGLRVTTYEFFNKEISLMYLPIFSDDAVFPQVAASSTAKDFRKYGIALDLGSVAPSKSNFEVGYVQEVTQKAISGMASDSYEVSNTFDGMQFEMLAEFLPICYFPNRLGQIYAAS